MTFMAEVVGVVKQYLLILKSYSRAGMFVLESAESGTNSPTNAAALPGGGTTKPRNPKETCLIRGPTLGNPGIAAMSFCFITWS